jgi:hypothetical protein
VACPCRWASSTAHSAAVRPRIEDRPARDGIRKRVWSLGNIRPDRRQEPLRRLGDVGHGGVERISVARRGRPEAGHLAHVLERGGAGLARGGGPVVLGPAELAD